MPTSNAGTAALKAYKTKGNGSESSTPHIDITVGQAPKPARTARRGFSQVLAERLER